MVFSQMHGQKSQAPQQPDAAGENVIFDTTTKTFMADVVAASKNQPVLVDFWAPWCGPCKQLTPILEKVVQSAGGKIRLAKMNIDEHPAIAGQLGIQSIPAVIAFHKGQMSDGFMGALPEGQIKEFIERLIGPFGENETTSLLAQGAEHLNNHDAVAATDVFAQVLATDAENLEALAGLIRARILTGDLSAARAMLEALPEARQLDKALSRARSELDVAEQSQHLGPIQELKSAVEQNENNHQARFDLALALAAKGKREDAAEHLLTIIRKDRAFNDDGARKQLVLFFESWGTTDPVTLSARRALSMLLFS